MKPALRRAGAALAALAWLALPAAAPAAPFQVFDATSYKNKPDLSKLGIQPARIVYTGELWHEGEPMDRPPAPLHVQDAARAALKSPADLLILDVEQWPLRGADDAVQAGLAKYQKLLAMFRAHAGGRRIGYYGLPVGRDYWRALGGPGSAEYKAWQKENDAAKPLAAEVDASLPSLYTFYPDPAGWAAYAAANLAEARRINPGKPVYAFLWPRYHDSNPKLKGSPVPPEFWKLQLETARRLADGVVIWGGWGEDGAGAPAQWREEAGWWQATKDFMKTLPRPAAAD